MKILVAEDEKNFGLVLKKELEDEGYTIDLVSDGVEAVMRFIDEKYDFVLVDNQETESRAGHSIFRKRWKRRAGGIGKGRGDAMSHKAF